MRVDWVRQPDPSPWMPRKFERYDAAGCLSDGRRFAALVRPVYVEEPWRFGPPDPERPLKWHWQTTVDGDLLKGGREDDAETALHRAEIAVHEYSSGDLAWWAHIQGLVS